MVILVLISLIASKIIAVLNEGPSDVVLLHIGTNQTPVTASGMMTILDRIDQWSAINFPVHVFVSTLVPKRDPIRQGIVDSFNNDLRRLISQRSNPMVTLVENALALAVEDISVESVGVHPNESGYERMAATWFAALSGKIFEPACRTLTN